MSDLLNFKGNYRKIYIYILVIMSWLITFIFYSLQKSINISTNHMDGAFQTASGLYRIAAGEYLGLDFYTYLGIAPLFLLYPLFKLMGSNLAASSFSSYFITELLGMLSIALIFHLICKSKSILLSIAVASVVYLFIGTLGLIPLGPGNSLRSIRAFAPYFSVFFLYLICLNTKKAVKKTFYSGIASGVILLWSNDYAISTFIIVTSFYSFYIIKEKDEIIKNILIYFFTSFFIFFIVINAVTLFNPINFLDFNFSNIRKDQWFYFLPYSDNARVYDFVSLLSLFLKFQILPFEILFIFILYEYFKEKSLENLLILVIGFSLFSGALVASVGGHVDIGYFHPFNTFIGLSITFFCIKKINLNKIKFFLKKINLINYALLILLLFPISTSSFLYFSNLYQAKSDPSRFFVPELGGFLPISWEEYISLARSTPYDKVVTCLVLSDQFHLETLAPVVNSICHPATNSDGV